MFASVAVIIRLVVLIFLVVLGVFGNAGVPVMVHRAKLRSHHVMLVAAFDFTATLIGPGVMLVSTVLGPQWLERNVPLCQSLAFLGTFTQMSSFLVLFCLTLFCQKRRVTFHGASQRKLNTRQNLSLAVVMATASLICIAPFLGWSSFNGLPWSCSPPFHGDVPPSISSYSLAYLLSSFLVVVTTTVLGARAVRRRRLYPVRLFWQRHQLEMRSNDPEVTTTTSSNTTSNTLRSFRSRCSSQFSGSRSAAISNCSTPMISRKCSILPGVAGVTMSDALGPIPHQRALLSYPGYKSDPSARPQETAQDLGQRFYSGSSFFGLPQEPFVISRRVSSYYPVLRTQKHVFRSPKRLPSFTPFQKQRFWSRFVILRCCLNLACWTPLWAIATLQFFSVRCCPNESHLVAYCLTYLPSSICPFLLMCDVGYRRACGRTAYSLLQTCSRRKQNHVNLLKSRDATERIRLNYVTPLDPQKL